MTKKYRKSKSGMIHYKSGAGWRKRFCEVSGGFIIVHAETPIAHRKQSSEERDGPPSPGRPASSPTLQQRDSSSGATLTPHKDSVSSFAYKDPQPSPRGKRSGKQLREKERDGRIRMLAALEGCTVTTAQLMPFCFKVGTSKWSRHFYAETQEEMLEWIGACSYWADQGKYNNFESFAPIREVRFLFPPCA